MRAECQFAKAGQGLFYNGLLVDQGGRSFSFVYDCGTLDAASVLMNSISEHKALIGQRLDLLSVSHFHQDHVSHIPELIDGLELGTVVIPFVRPELRLLLAAQYDDISDDGDRIRMYGDPEMYFIAHGAERVIIASGDENKNGNDKFDFFGKPPEEYPQKEGKENLNHTVIIGNKTSADTTLFTNKADEYRGCFSIVAPSYLWEFRFKNLYYDCMRSNFWGDITKLLERHNNSFDEILKNKTYIKQLQKIYRDNFEGKFNDTSLILLSRPLRRGWLVDKLSCWCNCSMVCSDCKDECIDDYLNHGQAATLLLGDLTEDYKLFDRYFHRIENHISQIPQIIQTPHHGAKIKHHSFCREFCHDLNRGRHLPIMLVASYGIKNRYGHPHLSSYKNCNHDDLCWRNTHIELVNERKDYSYTIIAGGDA